jgi:hypothetical protein
LGEKLFGEFSGDLLRLLEALYGDNFVQRFRDFHFFPQKKRYRKGRSWDRIGIAA